MKVINECRNMKNTLTKKILNVHKSFVKHIKNKPTHKSNNTYKMKMNKDMKHVDGIIICNMKCYE
jgi:hypothetical protein